MFKKERKLESRYARGDISWETLVKNIDLWVLIEVLGYEFYSPDRNLEISLRCYEKSNKKKMYCLGIYNKKDFTTISKCFSEKEIKEKILNNDIFAKKN